MDMYWVALLYHFPRTPTSSSVVWESIGSLYCTISLAPPPHPLSSGKVLGRSIVPFPPHPHLILCRLGKYWVALLYHFPRTPTSSSVVWESIGSLYCTISLAPPPHPLSSGKVLGRSIVPFPSHPHLILCRLGKYWVALLYHFPRTPTSSSVVWESIGSLYCTISLAPPPHPLSSGKVLGRSIVPFPSHPSPHPLSSGKVLGRSIVPFPSHPSPHPLSSGKVLGRSIVPFPSHPHLILCRLGKYWVALLYHFPRTPTSSSVVWESIGSLYCTISLAPPPHPLSSGKVLGRSIVPFPSHPHLILCRLGKYWVALLYHFPRTPTSSSVVWESIGSLYCTISLAPPPHPLSSGKVLGRSIVPFPSHPHLILCRLGKYWVALLYHFPRTPTSSSVVWESIGSLYCTISLAPPPHPLSSGKVLGRSIVPFPSHPHLILCRLGKYWVALLYHFPRTPTSSSVVWESIGSLYCTISLAPPPHPLSSGKVLGRSIVPFPSHPHLILCRLGKYWVALLYHFPRTPTSSSVVWESIGSLYCTISLAPPPHPLSSGKVLGRSIVPYQRQTLCLGLDKLRTR
ncbi:hypothetical protein M8J76_008547 [Diaphorina citri]|nr:hypothetical protein M8J76_008547 [Diaphorina citri]